MSDFIDNSLRVILLSSKVLGMFPFNIVKGSLILSWPWLLHSVSLIVFSFYTFMLTGAQTKMVRFQQVLFFVELAILNLSILFSFVWLLFKYRCLNQILNVTTAARRRYGITFTCRRYLLQFLGISAFLIISFTVRLFLIQTWQDALLLTRFLLQDMVYIVTVMQFCSFNLLVGDCFVLLSAALVNHSRNQNELQAILLCHLRLQKAANSVNECYGLHNFCFISTSFFITTYCLYYIITVTGDILLSVYAGIFYPMLCYNIVHVCNETKNKDKMFTETLYHLAVNKKTTLGNNMKVNFHFAFTNEIFFTGCGFFELDFPLLCSMVQAATSFLLIILQFSTIEEIETSKPNDH